MCPQRPQVHAPLVLLPAASVSLCFPLFDQHGAVPATGPHTQGSPTHPLHGWPRGNHNMGFGRLLHSCNMMRLGLRTGTPDATLFCIAAALGRACFTIIHQVSLVDTTKDESCVTD